MNSAAIDSSFSKRDTLFFLGVFVFAYLHLFRLPATPIYFDGDTLVPVSNAIRILNGEAIYRDFFHFIAPGADLLYALLFSLFGQSVWVVNAVILALTLGQVAILWHFSRLTLAGPSVYLPSLIFVVFGFRQFGIDGSYRLMGVILALAAVALVASKRTRVHLLSAGLLCAAASFFQQPRGVLVAGAIGLFLAWEHYVGQEPAFGLLKKWLLVAGSFLAGTILLHGYFVWQLGAQEYYSAIFGFIGSSYRSDPFNNNTAYLSDLRAYLAGITAGGSFASSNGRLAVISAFYYLLVPYIYAAFLAYAWFRRSELRNNPSFRILTLLCITGILMAIGVSAPTITRVFHVAIPAIVLFVWLASRIQFVRSGAPIAAGLMAVACVVLSVQRQAAATYELDMPAGRSSFLFEPTFEKYRWIGVNTSPGDLIYEPSHPNYYFPFHLRNPTPLYMARDSAYTPASQVDWVVRSLNDNPPRFIIWPESWSKEPGDRAEGDSLAPLWDFVKNRYVPVHRFRRINDPAQFVYPDNIVYKLRDGLSNR